MWFKKKKKLDKLHAPNQASTCTYIIIIIIIIIFEKILLYKVVQP